MNNNTFKQKEYYYPNTTITKWIKGRTKWFEVLTYGKYFDDHIIVYLN